MKKQLISLVLALLPLVASAYDVLKDGIYYNLNNSTRTAEVASASNTNVYSGELEIPESFTYGNTTYNVTSIGTNAFKECTNLTGVVIPSTVKSFGEDTFFGCTGLKYIISLIENPFEIPKYTFYYNSPSEGVKPLPCMLFVIGGSSQLYRWKRYEGWNANLYSDDSEFSDNINGVKTKFRVISVKNRTCKLYDGFGAIPTTTTGVYTIPESTCGFTMTGIGYGAFMDCSGLTGIIIPNTVTDIGIIPFMNCTGLTNITIPSSVKNIEEATFKLTNITVVKVDAANGVYDSRDNCNAIIKTSTNTLVSGCKATIIPSSVTAIGDLAFEGISIESVDIPELLTSIGSSAFRNCNKLTSITIPSGVTNIGSAAFQYCDNLSSVTMMRTQPIAIDENTFSNRANATLYVPAKSKAAYETADYWKEFKEIVEMPAIIDFADANVKALCVANWDTDSDGELSEAEAAAVTDLGRVFKGNTTITSFDELQYFTGLTNIARNEFNGCSNLTSVSIPSNVTRIGSISFAYCSSLNSITIPSNVTSILDWAFAYCTGLTSVTIPSSVATISSNIFRGCRGLTSITVESGNKVYDSRDNCNAIIQTANNKLISGCQNTIIPLSVTSIGDYAFSGCSGLTSVTIPSSVTSIGTAAFNECTSLVSVEVNNQTPVSIAENTFSNRTNATLYVPIGCKTAYEAADYWKEFKEIIEPSPIIAFADTNVKALCVANWDTDGDGELSEAEAAAVTNLRYVFKEKSNITSFNELRYFTGLTSINDRAFYNCSKLASIVIPINVTTIGENAFFDCEALTSLTIPSSVTNIGVGAFLDCGFGLNSIIVESGNTIYDSRNNCNAIIETKTNKLLWGCNNTVIPNSVKSIGNSAFSHCMLIESISIPDGVTSIGNWAFYNCQKLSSVDIPDLVTTIGEEAFWHCDALSSVTIGKSIASIGSCAFQDCDNLISVTVGMSSPVSITDNLFTNRANATLNVPKGSKAAYEAADYWKEFKDIKEFPNGEQQKCATPVISYENGKFKFTSSTEGASFKSTFAYNATSTEMDGNEVAVPSTITFHVSVYATKDGYENSDTATKDIEVNVNSSKIGDINNDGKVTVTDSLMILDMILENKE